MRVLVCGGRAYDNRDLLYRTLDRIHLAKPITLLICGGATGADAMACDWAALHNVKREVYPAEWDLHGKKAGPLRNARMLNEGNPDVVIAFPGGKGTSHMVMIARRKRVPVYEAGKDQTPLNFDSEPARQKWIIENADHFTVVMRYKRNYYRDNWPTLEKAQQAARRTVNQYRDRTVMIYAVWGQHDTWVQNVKWSDNATAGSSHT